MVTNLIQRNLGFCDISLANSRGRIWNPLFRLSSEVKQPRPSSSQKDHLSNRNVKKQGYLKIQVRDTYILASQGSHHSRYQTRVKRAYDPLFRFTTKIKHPSLSNQTFIQQNPSKKVCEKRVRKRKKRDVARPPNPSLTTLRHAPLGVNIRNS